MKPLAKPTLESTAKLAESFAQGKPISPSKVTKIFHAPAGYRRLTINLKEDIHKKIRRKAIDDDCTVTDIITKLLENEVK
jgi:hypothetical protein